MTMTNRPTIFVLLGSCALLLQDSTINAFTPTALTNDRITSIASGSILRASIEGNSVADEQTILKQSQEFFPSAELEKFEMVSHTPLGCTVEETLDPTQDFVFVSKVTPGGNAEKAGIKVGDVIVAVTGMFGGMDAVLESGIEKIKGLVGAVDESDPLAIQVARGTDVLERHEKAVVDMCQITTGNDKEIEQCVETFLKDGYDINKGSNVADDDDDDDKETACDDGDTECLIDDMFNLWAEDLPPPTTTSGITNAPNEQTSAKKVKPWSSRSSPSGTFVRDPRTGEMRNIDETDWRN